MIDEKGYQSWASGINNRAPSNRIPEGSARDILNLDPGPLLRSRVGYEKKLPTTNARAIASLGHRVIFVDGTELTELDTHTDAVRVLGTIAGAGPVAFAGHNSELFISTVNETLRYDGQLREWGVPDVTVQPAAGVASVTEGRRLYAMTYVNQYGEEGGTVAAASVPAGELTITVPTLPAGCTARIYVSALNGRTLYYQTEATAAGPIRVVRPVDYTATLATMHMRRPKPCVFLASAGAVLAMASGDTVNITEPLWPHLVNYEARFIQYPSEVGMLLAGLHGMYVSADKCYMVTNAETESPQQSGVLDYPAIYGTGTILPTGEATWVTRYGVAIESRDSREGILEPTKPQFVVGKHVSGASGFVEYDGGQRLVATMKRSEGQGTLAACDYFEAEVIRP